MKDKILAVAGVLIVLAIISGLVYGSRLFSNAVTPITVHEVEKGIKCATMVTDDGAAIDCWKE